ncbi:hypothetical protein, partial [Actinomyces sp. MRS3W]|uniref:hypothetical protein n=1 Tax=Actinomyces sp. MRS3W TaxID=2800796 RepID=UPI0028FDC1AB
MSQPHDFPPGSASGPTGAARPEGAPGGGGLPAGNDAYRPGARSEEDARAYAARVGVADADSADA